MPQSDGAAGLHAWSTRLLAAAAAALAVGVVFEAVLSAREERRAELARAQVRPVYSWAFHSTDGRRLGRQEGVLKLIMDPLTVYRNLPNQRTRWFTVNSLGLRGPEPSGGPKAKRILVVGGSAAFGTGLPSDADTFAVRLQGLLPGTEALNAAVIGYESAQEAALAAGLRDLKPVLIVALDGFNDYGEVLKPSLEARSVGVNGFEQVEDRLRVLDDLTAAGLPTRLLNLTRVLFPLTDEAARKTAGRLRGALRGRPESANVKIDRLCRAYVSNITAMASAGRGWTPAARTLAVFQVLRPSDKPGGPPDAMAQGYALFKKCARRELARGGVPGMELDAAPDIRGSMFMDRLHLDPAGNASAAKAVAAFIREKRLLEAEAR